MFKEFLKIQVEKAFPTLFQSPWNPFPKAHLSTPIEATIPRVTETFAGLINVWTASFVAGRRLAGAPTRREAQLRGFFRGSINREG